LSNDIRNWARGDSGNWTPFRFHAAFRVCGCRSGRLQKAGAALLAQSVAVAADGEDVAVVEQAVEDGGGHPRIAKDLAPLADGAIAGGEQAAALVPPRHELEEEMGGVLLERQVAEFVEDEPLRLGVEADPVLEAVLGMGARERGDEARWPGRRVPLRGGPSDRVRMMVIGATLWSTLSPDWRSRFLSAADAARRRQWSDADKLRIVEASVRGSRMASATARAHGISRLLLTTWRRQFREGTLGTVDR
jgi:hypothetical protein